MEEDDFRALTDKTTVVLESVDLEKYYGGRCLADQAIGALARALTDTTQEQRAALSATLSAHSRRVLGRFMLRAPVLALRDRDAAVLREGLLVNVLLEQQVGDWRDDLVEFAPYYYAAQQIGLSPEQLFDEVARFAIPELATIMRTFGRRRDVTLSVFGWRRIDTPEGPTLEALGMKGQPTGAVVGSPSWDSVNDAMVRDLLQWVESQRGRKRPDQA